MSLESLSAADWTLEWGFIKKFPFLNVTFLSFQLESATCIIYYSCATLGISSTEKFEMILEGLSLAEAKDFHAHRRAEHGRPWRQ